ncbi:arpin-like [Lineus longissimus]|uniref:arpin-like n=1 Tax=Lineus longissimus TaxID=88925 RepID=UPI002B4CF211
MSRIYENKPLQSVPIETHQWKTLWKPATLQSGNGILIEGSIQGRSRHVIADSAGSKLRYLVLHIKLLRCHKRKFDKLGKEIEPNFSETKKVNIGHLNSSYKVEAKGETDRISNEEATAKLTLPDLKSITAKHSVSGCLPLWIEEATMEKMDLDVGDEVRLKTKGDSPFIFSISKIEGGSSKASNYVGGDQVGGSWTDKIFTEKIEVKTLPQDQPEGVDDDEWDD